MTMRMRQGFDPDHNLWDLVAHELRRQRESRDLPHRVVADLIDRDRSLVALVEAGEVRLQEKHAAKIDDAWVTGGLLRRLVRYAKARHSAEWGAERDKAESEADQIRIWALGWIPGLAQTEDYARAAFTEAGRQDVAEAVSSRMARQEVLTGESPPLVWALIDQDALEHRVGSPEVHRAQLARLLELADQSAWTIRVVRREAGGHVGRDGSFQLYTVGAEEVAYTETPGLGRLIRDPSEVALYDLWFRQIGDVAESKRQSIALMKAVMEENR
jgi:uncharacterized protein DUF5753